MTEAPEPAFLDGNKRTALAGASVFLKKNGLKISPPNSPREHVEAIKALAQDNMERAAFATYLKERTIEQP